MTHYEVQLWLDRYVAAWSSYDPEEIADLFAEDVSYRHQPWSDPVVGRDAVVADWLADKDEPGSWEAHYDAWAVEDDLASALGESRYTNPDGSFRALYFNHFALRFDGHGKCIEFVDYFMELPERLREGR